MSWELKKIGDVLKLEYGKPLPKEKRNEAGTYVAYGANGIKCRTDEYYWDKPSIIIGRKGSAGEINLTEEKFWPLDVTYFAIFDDQKYDLKFLYFCLQRLNLTSLAKGVKPGINRNDVYALEAVFPPLPEQKRIVAILDEAFAGIDAAVANTEKNLANARELFEGTAQAIFRGRTDWDKLSLAELLDREWITSHLDGNHGGNYPRKAEFVDSGIPYLSANCIKNESVDISLAKYLSPERAASLRKGIAQNRDVLFAHNATVGPVAMLYTDLEKVILSTSLTYYRCNLDHINPEYLAHYMRSPEFKNQYKLVMRQSTRNQVPITKQREFIHIIPTLSEQAEIAKKLDGLSSETSRLESVYQQKLESLAELKQSILQKAFAGELTTLPVKEIDETVA